MEIFKKKMSGSSLEAERLRLIEILKNHGISDEKVLKAIKEVPREHFVLPEIQSHAYDNRALAIENGQTISQPFIVAIMTEHLMLTPDDKVLEIGTGSGYQAAILAKLAKEVYTVERISPLSGKAQKILGELGFSNIKYHVGDGTLGWKEHAPFDAIIVTAYAAKVPPHLLDQLADGGHMVIPVGREGYQSLDVIERNGSEYITDHICGCVFVPLIESENI